MRSINLPNDIQSVVRMCLADVLKYYKKYQAKVKKRYTIGEKKGCIDVYCPDFSSKSENDPTGYLFALPLQMNSNLIPEVDDWILIEFPFGKIDPCCYSVQSPYLYKYLKSSENKTLFEFKQASIYYDQTNDYIVIENGDSKFTIRKTLIEIKSGSDTIEKSVLGESLKKWLEKFLDDLKTFTVMTPTGPSGTIGDMPANSTKIASAKSNLTDILSNKVKNN